MEQSKKRMLGYASLAAVLAMTAFASTLPDTPAQATSTGASVTYSVTVINPMNVEVVGGDGDNPVIVITPDTNLDEDNTIDHIDYVVKDEDGNVVIGPVVEDVPEGTTEIELPFIDKELPPGDYTIVINGYNKDGDIVVTREVEFTYTAPIFVPDTGTLTLGDLQIAHASYWAAGLVCALIAGGVAFGLYKRARK